MDVENPENSSTTKGGEHTPSGFLMSMIPSFKEKKILCIQKGRLHEKGFVNPWRIINFKNNKMKLLTSKQQESYEKAKNFYIC